MPLTRQNDIGEPQYRQDRGNNLKTWSVPQCAFLIECSAAVLAQIGREVAQARHSRHGPLETGGVLFGNHEPARIRIVASKPLPCEHAMGPGFVLSESDEKHLAQLIALPAVDPALNGLEALGWYHSHLRSRIFLSQRDLQVHSRYFAAAHQIALVIHPASEQPAHAGLFCREFSGEMRPEASAEFTIAAPAAPAPAPAKPEPALANKPARAHKGAPVSAQLPPRVPELICPKCGSRHLRRSHRTGPVESCCAFFGFYPHRCQECLSRSFLRTSNLLERIRFRSWKRPEQRKRVMERTRREILLWGCGILGFMAILYYMVRDTGFKSDQP